MKKNLKHLVFSLLVALIFLVPQKAQGQETSDHTPVNLQSPSAHGNLMIESAYQYNEMVVPERRDYYARPLVEGAASLIREGTRCAREYPIHVAVLIGLATQVVTVASQADDPTATNSSWIGYLCEHKDYAPTVLASIAGVAANAIPIWRQFALPAPAVPNLWQRIKEYFVPPPPEPLWIQVAGGVAAAVDAGLVYLALEHDYYAPKVIIGVKTVCHLYGS